MQDPSSLGNPPDTRNSTEYTRRHARSPTDASIADTADIWRTMPPFFPSASTSITDLDAQLIAHRRQGHCRKARTGCMSHRPEGKTERVIGLTLQYSSRHGLLFARGCPTPAAHRRPDLSPAVMGDPKLRQESIEKAEILEKNDPAIRSFLNHLSLSSPLLSFQPLPSSRPLGLD